MITGALVLFSLVLGYALTVGCSLVATFGITSASPEFVAREARVTPAYKRLQALIWLACVMAGAFVTGIVAPGIYPWAIKTALITILIGMLWWNTWEARQRGMAHQILLSLLTIIGVIGGHALARHFVNIQGSIWNR